MAKQPEHLNRASRPLTLAAVQMSCGWDGAANIARAEQLVREAAARGARVILLPELFETPYFCIEQDARHLRLASTVEDNPAVRHFAAVARELGVVLPVSFFERAGPAYFNSVAILDADGSRLGVYRKSHIPNGPGYQEKNYFSPGDTGFKVWHTRYARHRRWNLLGSVVSGGRARHGARGRRNPALSDGDRHRAAARAAGELARSLAAHATGSRRRQSHAARRGQSLRARALAAGSRKGSTSASTAPPSSRTRWARRSRKRGRRETQCSRPRSTWRRPRRCGTTGSCFATGVPISMAR